MKQDVAVIDEKPGILVQVGACGNHAVVWSSSSKTDTPAFTTSKSFTMTSYDKARLAALRYMIKQLRRSAIEESIKHALEKQPISVESSVMREDADGNQNNREQEYVINAETFQSYRKRHCYKRSLLFMKDEITMTFMLELGMVQFQSMILLIILVTKWFSTNIYLCTVCVLLYLSFTEPSTVSHADSTFINATVVDAPSHWLTATKNYSIDVCCYDDAPKSLKQKQGFTAQLDQWMGQFLMV
uniref:BCAS3 domain-containing protein n=1 Tax=Heterorhabditis bacteriophora TaxID=37862 RepID=A0A1I7XQI0_HETBA